MSNYTYERVSKAKLADLQVLFKEVFNINYSLQYIETKIDTFNTPLPYFGFLAYHISGEVAGYYGALACYKIIEGEEILCAQSADTMVSPKHQGQGLFKKLYDLTLELGQQHDVKFIFGFPNQVSYPMFVKALKWDNPRNLEYHFLKVTTIPLAKLAYQYSTFEQLYMKTCKLVFHFFFQSSNAFTDTSTDKSFQYKVRNGRNFLIKVSQTKVWISILNGLWIGKIEGKLGYNQIISKLKPLCYILGLPEIRVISDPIQPTEIVLPVFKTKSQPIIIKFIDPNYQNKKISFEGYEFDMF
jgi:GNAT superfamily N-acetyltransferase